MRTISTNRPRIAAVALAAAIGLVAAGCTSSDGSAGSEGESQAVSGDESEVASIWESDVPAKPSPGCDAPVADAPASDSLEPN